MLVHRLDTVLARTDPFELAQALERYVRAMSPERIRSVVIDARDRIGAYYRSEFIALLAEFGAVDRVQPDALNTDDFVSVVREAGDGEALQGAFARLLKSNLRAIPLFGATFTQGVLDSVSSDRAVAIGEEPRNTRMRAIVLGGVAVALVFAGAAGEHVIATVRTQNAIASPLPQVQAAALAVASPTAPPVQQRSQTHVKVVAPSPRVVTPAPAARLQVQQQQQPPTPPPQQPPPVAAPVIPQPARTQAPRDKHTPPPAQGIATVALPDPTPTPQPSDLDVSDMPDVFTDATPLPSQSPAPAQVPSGVTLKTPTPPPRHKSWIKRTISHLNPFKP